MGSQTQCNCLMNYLLDPKSNQSMKRKNKLLFIFLLYSFSVFSQNKVTEKYNLVKITNNELDSILNNIISYSKKCKFNSNRLSFKIEVFNRRDTTFLDISSTSFPEVFFLDSNSNPIGILNVNGFDFIFFGDRFCTLFKILKEKSELNISNQNRTFVFEDPPEWLFLYTRCHFKLLKIENECL
jgi:hypothetical protein